MRSGCGSAKTNRLDDPGTGAMIAQRTPGRVSLRSTRWVPRLGRSRMSGTSWPAHTPVALMTAGPGSLLRLAGARVGEDGSGRRSASLDPHPGVHAGAVGDRRAGDREHQPGVVLELAVPGQDRATQALAAYDGSEGQRLGDADAARPRQGLALGARREAQQVARPGCRPARAPAWVRPIDGVSGQHHRQRADEVRSRGLHQDAALDGALVGHVDLAARQVAQAAVHELGAPPAGAVGDVVGVDRDHGEAAARGVEGDAGAGDAEADDEHVGGLRDAVQADG